MTPSFLRNRSLPGRLALGLALLPACVFGDAHSRSIVRDAGPSDDADVVDAAPIDTLRRAEVVAALANLVFGELVALETSLASLDVAVAAYAAAPTDVGLRDAARTAWRDAMVVVQRLEVMQFGPAAHPASALGGTGLRDEYYAWPLISRCGVDQRIVSGGYAPPSTLELAPINVRGLDVLEELLFDEATGNHCDSFDPINATGTWAAVSDLAARRADYAASVASIAHAEATALRLAWDPAGGDFLAQLTTAGSAGRVYPSAQEALNAISNAMFYLDTQTKDMKVGVPAGIALGCAETSCPDAVEAALSDASLAHIRANLVGFKLLLTGGEGAALGFDDLLNDLGQGALVASMVSEIDGAIAAIDAVTLPLEVLVDAEPEAAAALYDELKHVTDLLKTQFLAVLDLDRPMSAAGDND